MPNTSNFNKPPRKDLCVFYLLDTSGSMYGDPINVLNRAMEETMRALKDQAAHNGDAHVKIAVMSFNTNPKWMQPNGPEYIEDFVWEDMVAGGTTNVGAALRELNSKLDPAEFLASKTGGLPPVIIFMTDGLPTDDYENALQECRQNKLFRKATRIGIGIGDNPDLEMVTHLAGSSEAVIRPKDLRTFATLLRFVSMSSTIHASKPDQDDPGRSSGAIAVAEARSEAGIQKDDEIEAIPAYTEPVVPEDLDDNDEWGWSTSGFQAGSVSEFNNDADDEWS